MARAASWRTIKSHRNYTYDELSHALGKHKRTIMQWVRKEGLQAFTSKRPHLIRGCDVKEFLKGRSDARKCKLDLTEFLCMGCRDARKPAEALVECSIPSSGGIMATALCPHCTSTMHKRVARDQLPELQQKLDVTIMQAES